MSYEEAVKNIALGYYRHFKGNEYEVIGIARHSEDESPMVVYRALYGDGGLWTSFFAILCALQEIDKVQHLRFF